jgi:hypothetical protein
MATTPRIKHTFRYNSLAEFSASQYQYYRDYVGDTGEEKIEEYRASRRYEVPSLNNEIQTGKTKKHYLEAIAKATAALPQQKQPLKPAIKHSVIGSSPSVGRYLNGHPRNMFKRVNNEQPTPAVKIAVSLDASSNTDTDQIANRAAAILSVLADYDAKNIKTHVDFTISVPSDIGGQTKNNELHVITMKRHHQKLSLPELTYLCDERLLRGLGFVAIERSTYNKDNELSSSGYGTPQRYAPEEMVGYDIFFDGIHGSRAKYFNTPEQALETIQKELDAQTTPKTKAA